MQSFRVSLLSSILLPASDRHSSQYWGSAFTFLQPCWLQWNYTKQEPASCCHQKYNDVLLFSEHLTNAQSPFTLGLHGLGQKAGPLWRGTGLLEPCISALLKGWEDLLWETIVTKFTVFCFSSHIGWKTVRGNYLWTLSCLEIPISSQDEWEAESWVPALAMPDLLTAPHSDYCTKGLWWDKDVCHSQGKKQNVN